MVGPRYGVRWTPSYSLSHHAFLTTGDFSPQGVVGSLTPEFRYLAGTQTPFSGYEFARQFDTMLIEPPIYLPAMMQDFQIAGGKVVVREIHTPAEVASLPEKLVFNCTGLGAKALFNDAELTPVKGQLTFLLPQPEVEYSVVYGSGLYMFSRHDGILLGGTHDEGDWSLNVDNQVRDQIVAKHKAVLRQYEGVLAGLAPREESLRSPNMNRGASPSAPGQWRSSHPLQVPASHTPRLNRITK